VALVASLMFSSAVFFALQAWLAPDPLEAALAAASATADTWSSLLLGLIPWLCAASLGGLMVLAQMQVYRRSL
jgi:hypothetical protein